MISSSKDWAVLDVAVRLAEELGDDPDRSVELRDALDRVVADAETLGLLEQERICGRCPIQQTRRCQVSEWSKT